MKYTIFLLLLATIACNNSNETQKTDIKETLPAIKKEVLYTCPMHPNVREHKPGKCPICGMTLVPVNDDSQPMKMKDTAAVLTLSPRQQLLANIHVDTIGNMAASSALELTGTTVFNPEQAKNSSAWVSGWIEKMYVRNPGEKISAGQKLYELYSPDLLAAEKDYLLTLKQQSLFKKANVDLSATLQSMKQKLQRWGLSEHQISNLAQTLPAGRITVYSKTSGYLIQSMKAEGDYVKEGESVLNLSGNNTIWVQAQLYDNELPMLLKNSSFLVKIAGMNEMLKGSLAFDNPANVEGTRVHLVNIAVENPGGKIQPGMQAYVYLQTKEQNDLPSVPKSSIIYGAKNDYAWVALNDNKFERRTVALGKENESSVQITNGISRGEKMVSSGVYLLNSEYILQHGSGVNLSGMQMSDMKMKGMAK